MAMIVIYIFVALFATVQTEYVQEMEVGMYRCLYTVLSIVLIYVGVRCETVTSLGTSFECMSHD